MTEATVTAARPCGTVDHSDMYLVRAIDEAAADAILAWIVEVSGIEAHRWRSATIDGDELIGEIHEEPRRVVDLGLATFTARFPFTTPPSSWPAGAAKRCLTCGALRPASTKEGH